METIKQKLDQVTQNLQVEKTPGQSNSLTVSQARSQSDPDKIILDLKYAAPQIGTLSQNDQDLWADALLLKIHVITGWTIPERVLMNVLTDQFRKKLVEDYSHLNVEEIEYAFRKNGTIVKDWGKSMNLALIDEVLIPYSNQRFNLSAEEERKKIKPEQPKILTDDELDNLHRGDVEAFYQRCRAGRVPYAIPEYFKPILFKDGLLKESETPAEFFMRKLGMNAENIYVKNENDQP